MGRQKEERRQALEDKYWERRKEKSIRRDGERVLCIARLRHLPHPNPQERIIKEPLQRSEERFVGEYAGPGMCHVRMLNEAGEWVQVEYHSVKCVKTGSYRKVLEEDVKPLRWSGDDDQS